MIEYKTSSKGHKFIEISLKDMVNKLNSLGICDSCCSSMKNGYLIPILNRVYCEKCFNEWVEIAKFYEEDKAYEEEKTIIYLKRLN